MGMPLTDAWLKQIRKDTGGLLDRLAMLTAIQSPNLPPRGEEAKVQRVLANALWSMGMPAHLTLVERSREFVRHPAFRKDHLLDGRPNVTATLRGASASRSLCIVCHTDTLPPLPSGDAPDGIDGGKGALACALHAIGSLERSGLVLSGDVSLTSVVDECLAGVQGLLGQVIEGVGEDAALYLGAPRLELSFAGPAPSPESPGANVVEAWATTETSFVASVRRGTEATGRGIAETPCPPVCGAFLLSTYAGTPTAVVGHPTEAVAGTARPARPTEDLLDYACLLAGIIAEWCGLQTNEA